MIHTDYTLFEGDIILYQDAEDAGLGHMYVCIMSYYLHLAIHSTFWFNLLKKLGGPGSPGPLGDYISD